MSSATTFPASEALVLGRSNIVGKPMAHLLLAESCTVTIAHSRTRDLPGECQRADILVAAVGRPQRVKGDWVKPGATVIDVGINRIDIGDGKTKLVGDVDFDAVRQRAGAVTPVPRRRRPHDYRLLAAQYLDRGLPPTRRTGTGTRWLISTSAP